jgi:hypothetical protein
MFIIPITPIDLDLRFWGWQLTFKVRRIRKP